MELVLRLDASGVKVYSHWARQRQRDDVGISKYEYKNDFYTRIKI